MNHFIRKVSHKAGLSPGALLHVGEKKQETVRLTMLNYNNDQFTEHAIDSVQEALPFLKTSAVSWISIEGLNCLEIFEDIEQYLGVHPLTLEDVLNTTHRPKCEDFESYLFFILKMLSLNSGSYVHTEQVSLIIGPNFLLSIQEKEGNIFETVRERIRKGKGRIRKSGSDYLAYALIDAIVDQYFIVLESLGEEIDLLEEELLQESGPNILQRIHKLKRTVIQLRRQMWPVRDAVSNLIRGGSELVSDQTLIFLNDIHDHAIHIIDTVEAYRDTLSSLVDLYLSIISNHMNEVMKLLTIIATLFIPVTFVAGVYGMNFKYMPELNWRWGYWGVWSLMLGIAGAMLIFFKRKKWL